MRGWILGLLVLTGCAESPYGASITYNARNPEPIRVIMPPNAPSITQQFRPPQDTVLDGATTDAHVGLDVHARRGTPVLAAAAGRVTQSYFDPAYGNTLVVDHGLDEEGRQVMTRYLHLRTRRFFRGDTVVRGQKIGELGATGVLSGGFPHLHFEVIRDVTPRRSAPFDPHLFWLDGVGRVTCFDSKREIPALPFRTTYPVQCRGG